MYEPEKPPPWWLEAFILTRAVFGILMWPLLAIIGLLMAILGLIFAFAAHWGFGVLIIALVIGAIAVYAWWEKRRYPPLE